jgi:hypothetical protein
MYLLVAQGHCLSYLLRLYYDIQLCVRLYQKGICTQPHPRGHSTSSYRCGYCKCILGNLWTRFRWLTFGGCWLSLLYYRLQYSTSIVTDLYEYSCTRSTKHGPFIMNPLHILTLKLIITKTY